MKEDGEIPGGWILGGEPPPGVEWFDDPRLPEWRELCESRGMMRLRAGRLPDGRELLFWYERGAPVFPSGGGFIDSDVLDVWRFLRPWVESRPPGGQYADVPSAEPYT